MTTEKTTTEHTGYETAGAAAAGETARVSALLAAIGRLSELIEECVDNRDAYPLATAIQACVESAQRHGDIAAAGIVELQHLEASHG